MERRHKVGVGIFLAVKLLLIISVIYLAMVLVDVKSELNYQINSLRSELQEQILENQKLTQGQITELSSALLSTKQDLTTQFNELKASASEDFSGIIQDVIPSVVSVGTDTSQGSGFIIDEEGYIVTNAHVLSGARYAKILTYESNNWKPAELIGYDSTMDIAILKISGSYEDLEFGDSDDVEVGEKVIALGNPLGLSFSVTEGIVSALDRQGPNNIEAYIQIDTPLNRGNSGGPLVNKQGKVIGVNNFKIADSENLGFALEADYAVDTINNIFEVAELDVSI